MELLPTLWVKKHRIKNEAGNPIEFGNHNFLYDIYNDMSPLQVVLKAPQVGMTVLQIIKTLYCAKKQNWDIIYTLPTQSDVYDMAGGKINRIIAQNPIMNTWVRDHDTVEQKAVGENIIYYRGTFTNKAAMMVSSDLNVHDEVDASDASVIQQYETRLQAKADGRRWYFSHPSLAGFGVDIPWQHSDKKEWFVCCEHCHNHQQLKWPDNINKETKHYICSECKGEMSDKVREKGYWKATDQGEFSGYHISQLMCPWISAEKILKDYEEKDEQYFYNYVLGLPFVGSENKIDPSIVLKNVTPQVNTQEDTIVIGVDTGLPIHYTVMNKDGAFYYGTCKDYGHLENLLNRWSNCIMVADQGGDLIGIRSLQEKYPGKVYLAYYRRDRKGKDMIKWGTGNDHGVVVVDRNRMIQMAVDQMRDIGRIRLNGSVEDWKDWATHWGNIYRTVKEGPLGAEYIWERNGPDHFVHSFIYALTGLDRYSQQEAQIVGGDMFEGVERGRIFNSIE